MRLFAEIAFKNLYKFFTKKNYFTFYQLLFQYGDFKRHQQKLVKFYNYELKVADHLSFIFQFKEIFRTNKNYHILLKIQLCPNWILFLKKDIECLQELLKQLVK